MHTCFVKMFLLMMEKPDAMTKPEPKPSVCVYTVCFCPSPGLYGHSAVYHQQTDAVYVFGGYRFHVETVEPSGELYSLYYPNLTWSLLVPSQGNKAGPSTSIFMACNRFF